MIQFIYIACVWVGLPWASYADHYDLYEDMEYVTTLAEGSPWDEVGYTIQVCRSDYHTSHAYTYTAGNETGESGMSPPLTLQWVVNPDWDGNGVVGFPDFGLFIPEFGGARAEFDLDMNGSVGFTDFGRFVQRYGKCNNGKWELPCG